MLDKISLNAKICILCLLMALVSVFISIFAINGLKDVKNSDGRVIHNIVPNLALINSMAINFKEVRIELRTLGLNGLTKAQRESAVKGAISAIENYEKNNEHYHNIPFVAGEKELYEQLNRDWLRFKAVGQRVIELEKERETNPKVDAEMTMIFLKDCPESADLFNKSLYTLLTFHKKNLETYTSESEMISLKANSYILSTSIGGIILGIVISIMFAQNASKLSSTIKSIAYKLKDSATEVSNTSTKIASSSSELSLAANTQASSLQETSASIEEINSMIGSNTQNAKKSARASEESLANAERGKMVVADMIKAIEEINQSNSQIMQQIDKSNDEIANIVKLISEIGDKTKVINDIVFQTKLLSFNASVEAARAGENGKGFAVVAEEVGNLASMSGNAAVEISNMLNNSIQEVEAIVKNSQEKISVLMTKGKESVGRGTKVANECGEVLEEIVKSIASVSQSVTEISNASQEQTQGVHEVTKAIGQLDQVTQENSKSATESAEIASYLSQQSSNLSILVENLVQTIEGRKAT